MENGKFFSIDQLLSESSTMKCILSAHSVFLAMLALNFKAFADDSPATLLVSARVKSVEADPKGKSGTAVLEIVHVYGEGQKLKGQTFTDKYSVGADARGFAASQVFEVDEVGLWSIMVSMNGAGITADHTLPFRRRSRTIHTPRHAEHVKLAEAIESVYSVDERKRGKMLVALAGNELP
jgi:hypothetical protein